MSRQVPSGPFVYADPRQLCIGLHVHLDLQWTAHPFSFSSFKIKTQEQIATLQSLGLTRVRISPARSDTRPLPLPAGPPAAPDAAATAAADPTAEMLKAARAKREQVQRLAAQQARVAACERELLASARVLKSINQNLYACPDQVRRESVALIDSIADSMLVAGDVAIQLMSDKIGNEDSHHHALNVALLSMMLAKELALPPESIRVLGLGALFHDIGKLDMPDRVVKKVEPHNKAELALLQLHCERGCEAVKALKLPAEALAVLAQHHEMVDASGYPKRLTGAQITPLAKIVAIVTRFDNLCSPNNPAHALTPHEALSLMFAKHKAKFDVQILGVFIRMMGVYPPGSAVQLTDDRYAMVVSVNSSRPLKPRLIIYNPHIPKAEALVVDLEQQANLGVKRIIKPMQLPRQALDYLSPRQHICYFFERASSLAGGEDVS